MNARNSTLLVLALFGLLVSACEPAIGEPATEIAVENTLAVQPTRADFSTPTSISTVQDNTVEKLSLVSEELIVHLDGSNIVTGPTLSPDVNHIAYVVQDGDQFMVVLDGQTGQPYEAVGLQADDLMSFTSFAVGGPLYFSEDSQHLAYVAKRQDKWFVVLDGKEGQPYDQIQDFAFALNGGKLAYKARKGAEWFVVSDGAEGPHYDMVGEDGYPINISADGLHMAYPARQGNQWFMVLDGKQGSAYDAITATTLSPDGQRIAYFAQKGGKWFAVIDGNESLPYDYQEYAYIEFSPDSQRVAYLAQKGDQQVLVVDGVEGPSFGDDFVLHYFSPDSKQVVYTVEDDTGSYLALVVRQN